MSWDICTHISKESSSNCIHLCIDLRLEDVSIFLLSLSLRIREVLKQKLDAVDVDGSYLYRKEQQLISLGVRTLPLSLPSVPLTGWEVVSADNYKEKNVPRVMSGTCILFCAIHIQQCSYYVQFNTIGLLYTFLAKECERLTGHGAFRALQRGYIHWASGRLSQIEVNRQHPKFCHVRCSMKHSMKSLPCLHPSGKRRRARNY